MNRLQQIWIRGDEPSKPPSLVFLSLTQTGAEVSAVSRLASKERVEDIRTGDPLHCWLGRVFRDQGA